MLLLTPKRHGYETAEMMYKWIKDGAEPPKTTYTSGILIARDTYQQVGGLRDELDTMLLAAVPADGGAW